MKECRSKAASGSPEAARHYSCGVAKEEVPSLTGREDHLAISAGYCKQRGFQSGVPQLSSTEARTPVPRMLYGFVLKSLSQCASKLAVIAGRDAGSCAMVCFRLPAKLFNAIELETVRSAFREIEDALDEQNVRGDPGLRAGIMMRLMQFATDGTPQQDWKPRILSSLPLRR